LGWRPLIDADPHILGRPRDPSQATLATIEYDFVVLPNQESFSGLPAQPINSNYFVQDLQKGKLTFRNAELEKVLGQKGKATARRGGRS
jgi:hypothetical protein